MSQLKIAVTKFTFVGLANFVLTFIIFTVMLKVIRLDYLISLGSAWIVGVIFSYVLNFLWIFKPEQRLALNGRFVKFLSAGLLSVILNMVALRHLVESTKIDPFYVQMALMPFIVILNFISTKYWSLRKNRR